jgi:hypothetical protein
MTNKTYTTDLKARSVSPHNALRAGRRHGPVVSIFLRDTPERAPEAGGCAPRRTV